MRNEHAAVRLSDGRVLLSGGFSGTAMDGARRDALLFDPQTNSFRATRSLLRARARHCAALLTDGRVLIVGGMGNLDDPDRKDLAAEIYDPSRETFTPVADLSCSPAWPDAAPLPGGGALVSCDGWYQLWDPRTGARPLPGPLVGIALQDHGDQHLSRLYPVANGRVLVVTRRDTSEQIWTFDPRTATWQPGAQVALKDGLAPQARWTQARNGTLLVVDDKGSGGRIIAIDPSNGSARILKDGLVPSATPTALEDGRVVVMGGQDVLDPVAAIYLGDPQSGFSRAWFGMRQARSEYTITALSDGSALVYGGQARALPAALRWGQAIGSALALLVAIVLFRSQRLTPGYRSSFVFGAVIAGCASFLGLAVMIGLAYGAIAH